MSHSTRKPDFHLCKNKGADQLRRNCSFAETVKLISLLFPTRIVQFLFFLSTFCICTGRFVWDLVGNPEAQFSRAAAHMRQVVRKLDLCESRHEKTGHLGFRPGLSLTRLYSHRRGLEAWNFRFVQLLHSRSAPLFSHKQNPGFLRTRII